MTCATKRPRNLSLWESLCSDISPLSPKRGEGRNATASTAALAIFLFPLRALCRERFVVADLASAAFAFEVEGELVDVVAHCRRDRDGFSIEQVHFEPFGKGAPVLAAIGRGGPGRTAANV